MPKNKLRFSRGVYVPYDTPDRVDSDDGVTDRQLTGIIERLDSVDRHIHSNNRRVSSLYKELQIHWGTLEAINEAVKDLMQVQERLAEKIGDIERVRKMEEEEGKTQGMGVQSGMPLNWYQDLISRKDKLPLDKKLIPRTSATRQEARPRRKASLNQPSTINHQPSTIKLDQDGKI